MTCTLRNDKQKRDKNALGHSWYGIIGYGHNDVNTNTSPRYGSLESRRDYVPNTGFADLTRSPPPLVQGAFADHGQKIMLTSKDLQTITNPSIPQPTTMTTTTTPVTYIAEEICNDGIDNDSDTFIDFSDGEC